VEFRATSPRLIPDDGLVVELQEVPRLPIPDPGPLKLVDTRLFDLTLFDAASGNELAELPTSYELRLQYSDEQIVAAGITDETTLRLFYLDGQQWMPAGVDRVDTERNEMISTVHHAGVFALGASSSNATENHTLFLPMINR
jgi:hypothetical protein